MELQGLYDKTVSHTHTHTLLSFNTHHWSESLRPLTCNVLHVIRDVFLCQHVRNKGNYTDDVLQRF